MFAGSHLLYIRASQHSVGLTSPSKGQDAASSQDGNVEVPVDMLWNDNRAATANLRELAPITSSRHGQHSYGYSRASPI